MHTRILTAALLVILTVRAADAQCPFEHPAHAAKLKGSLVQAFFPCMTRRIPNGTTEANVPSCSPALTYNEWGGAPDSGWRWGPKARGTVSLNALAGDVAVAVNLSNIVDYVTGLAEGRGYLRITLRMTLADSAGPKTLVDFQLARRIDLVHGKVSLRTTVLSILHLYYPQFVLPPCSNLEILDLVVSDENGEPFATLGFFLP